jgi:predicted TIM-barrel fold metal-dependent hydrolase
MLTRRGVLRVASAAAISGQALAKDGPDFERIDTHVHIHRNARALISALDADRYRVLDIVVCPAVADERFDLEAKLNATQKVSKESGRAVAWASTFDARDFEKPDFAERVMARLRQTFDDGAIAVKIWKNIGMAIKSKAGEYLLPDHRSLVPIYESIERAGRTLVAHLAEPDGAWMPLDDKNPEISYYSNNPQWHMHGRAGAPVKEAILSARDRVLARLPKLRVVGCHLGSHEDDLKQLAKRLDEFPNFAVDTAARVRYFVSGDHAAARDFLTRYQDRILYATDFSLRDGDVAAAGRSLKSRHDLDWRFFATGDSLTYDGRPTQGLALPYAVVRKIFRDNALRWLPGFGV